MHGVHFCEPAASTHMLSCSHQSRRMQLLNSCAAIFDCLLWPLCLCLYAYAPLQQSCAARLEQQLHDSAIFPCVVHCKPRKAVEHSWRVVAVLQHPLLLLLLLLRL